MKLSSTLVGAVIVTLYITCASALADDKSSYVTRDQDGSRKETLRPTEYDKYGVYDNRGRRVGTVEKTPYGKTVRRDNRGSRVETYERKRY